MRTFFAAFSLSISLAGAPALADTTPPPPGHVANPFIPNLAKHSELFWRGAQPPGGAALAFLKEQGVRTILDLQEFVNITNAEKEQAAALGLRHIWIPLPPLSKPKEEDVDRALAVLKDPANHPVFVHCQHGQDRTGYLLGLHRVEVEGWAPQRAFQEMQAHGFSSFQVLMKKYFFERAEKHRR